MTGRYLPQLDEHRCTACGDCIQLCPEDCLAWSGGLPWLPSVSACTGCGLCALICPDQAIEMHLDAHS
jgi:Pyruvate/2-oxoacid:ferredoxin oxidoreductase delta subunit